MCLELAAPVTTRALLHLAAGGHLAPEAEDTLARLARDHQVFHWHTDFSSVFGPPERREADPWAGAA